MTHDLYTRAMQCVVELGRLGIAIECEIELRAWLGQQRGAWVRGEM